ncbi:hypothetical protein DFH09DRAFT_1314633 [Mycena vulgaris]|nr:hypothetical protein DFH09DRAFT_1314633 [Mycena vulgaris]
MDGPHWLAQAHDIFNHLDITWGFEAFVFIYGIQYCLEVAGPTDNLPPGYLFLCPLSDLAAETPKSFQIPDQPAYWSLTPSGVDRLSDEVAQDLGFPAIQLEMYARGRSWDVGVYDGIRQFHESKGFCPYSQEVALELGYPPVQLSCDRDALLAHLHQSDGGDSYSDSDGGSCTEYFSEAYQESDADDCYANSDRVSCREDLSELWDEQSDSPDSLVEGATTVPEVEIDSVLCNAMEDHTSRYEDNIPANEDPSEVAEASAPSGHQCSSLDEVEMLALSWSLNIIIWMQLVLILAATAISFHDFLCHR